MLLNLFSIAFPFNTEQSESNLWATMADELQWSACMPSPRSLASPRERDGRHLVIRLTVYKAVEPRFAPSTAIFLRCAESCTSRVLVLLQTRTRAPSDNPAFNHWRSLGTAAVSSVCPVQHTASCIVEPRRICQGILEASDGTAVHIFCKL